MKNIKSFTLVEVMVVIFLLALTAGFGLVEYNKALEKSIERDAIIKLGAIQAAYQLYLAQARQPPGVNLVDLVQINQFLGAAIIAGDNLTFSHRREQFGAEPNKFEVVSQFGWELHFHDGATPEMQKIHCVNTGNSCPTCLRIPADGLVGCGVP